MLRRTLSSVVVVCAALAAGDSSVLAGSGGGAAGRATAAARAAFLDGVGDAERVLASATANLRRGLRDETTTPNEAAVAYLGAFTFFAGQVKKHADAASEALTADLPAAMTDADDPTLAGTQAGDGGALDRFADAMDASLDAARRRALSRARSFGNALAREGTDRQRMNVSLPPWTYARRVAPELPSAVAPEDDSIALLAVLAVRLDDGTVIVGVAGRAPSALSGKFDVRLIGKSGVMGAGPLLSMGGIMVTSDGTWSAVKVLNDPKQGEGVDAGNRVVAFGVEPYDGGLAGQQPARHQHAGVIGIP